MGVFSLSRRCVARRPLLPAALAGLVLLVTAAVVVRADDSKKTGDGAATTSEKPTPPQPPKSPAGPEAKPADDFGPPGQPRDDAERRAGPPRPDDQQRGPNGRQPGPSSGPGGPPNRPDSFGPGQPRGFQPGGPRPEWPSMEQSDREMIKLIKAENDLNRRTEELARDYREAPKDQRAKIKEDLKKLVTEQFDARQARRKLELTRFEVEVKRLREAAETREKKKQQIIEKRVSDLLGEEAEAGF